MALVTLTKPTIDHWRGLCLQVLLIWGLVNPGVLAGPYIPADDAMVVEQLPDSLFRAQKTLKALQMQTASSGGLDAAVQLASYYIELGRAEMDPRYYGYAEAALAPWWNSTTNPPPSVQMLRAVILQAHHNFSEALVELDTLLVRQPANAQAWLTRAMIFQAQGDPRLALQSCRRLVKLVARLVSTTCMVNAAGRMGQGETGYRLLGRIVEADNGSDPRIFVWALTVQGELAARLDHTQAAQKYFRQALATGIRDTHLLASYADFLLDEGRAGEVRELLADETRSDGLLLRLALAEQFLGDPALEGHLAVLKGRMLTARLRGDKLHLREAARAHLALLDNPTIALDLALDNWSVQREPSDARIVLEAALASSQPAAAQSVLDWLTTTGLEDRQLTSLVRRLKGAANDL